MKPSQGRRRHRSRSLAIGGVLTIMTLTGCLKGRHFHVQDDIRFIEPLQGDFVQTPLQLRWENGGLPAQRYAVFLDRAPIAPKQSIQDLETSERSNIFETTATELLLEFVSPRSTSVLGRRNVHRIVVIAIDKNGRRMSDESAAIDFTVVPNE